MGHEIRKVFSELLLKLHGEKLAPDYRYRRDKDTPEIRVAAIADVAACGAWHEVYGGQTRCNREI